jgi:hypothetical protein
MESTGNIREDRPPIWPSDWKKILFYLVCYKALFAVLLYLCIALLPHMFNVNEYYENFHFPTYAKPTEQTRLITWDAQHYLYLSHKGYEFLGDHVFAGFAVTTTMSLCAFVVFYQFVRVHFSSDAAAHGTLLMLAYPGAMFFSFIYSEAPFFLFSILFFSFLYRDRLGLASVAAFFLPLIRAVGVFAVLPFTWYVYQRFRREMREERRSCGV